MSEDRCTWTGKILYPTYADAERQARTYRKRFGRNGQVTTYRCTHCDGWHYGHKKRLR